MTNYGRIVGSKCLPLAKRIVKNKSKHVSGSYTYRKKKVNCSVFVSKVLQQAGLLKEGTTLYHTSANHKKDKIYDCVVNRTKVKHYEWHKTHTKYKDLPKKYKKQGCIYVYPSSIAVVGADGYIYGCHSSGKVYDTLGMIRHKKKTYEYTSPILVVGVPKNE